MPERPVKPARKRAITLKRKPTTGTRSVQQADIAKRAYYIHLEEGSRDELHNWLTAERELTAV